MKIPQLLRLVLALALTVSLAPRAGAQMLDEVWFKVRYAAKGDLVSSELDTAKASVKGLVYVRFRHLALKSEGDSTLYTFDVIRPTEDGNWVTSDSGSLTTLGDREQLMLGPTPVSDNDGTRWSVAGFGQQGFLELLFQARMKIKLDKQGAFKAASFRSVGGLVPRGVLGGGDDSRDFFGSCRVRGTSVALEDLPFEV